MVFGLVKSPSPVDLDVPLVRADKRIVVTGEHMRNGISGNAHYCAVAQALHEQLDPDATVTHYAWWSDSVYVQHPLKIRYFTYLYDVLGGFTRFIVPRVSFTVPGSQLATRPSTNRR